MNNGCVLKVAMNRRGMAQNALEQEISSVEQLGILAKVLAVSPNGRFIVMEKAQPINDFSIILAYYNVSSVNKLLEIREIRYLVEKYHLVVVDLTRLSSWGMLNGRPVVIDYGFSVEIRETYYRRRV